MAVQLIPGGILLASSLVLLETPRWLRSKGRIEEADKNLSILRGLPEGQSASLRSSNESHRESTGHPYTVQENEMTDQQLAVEAQKTHGGSVAARLREIFLPGIRNRLFMCFMLFLIQNATGINAINYYSPTVFQSIGIKGTNTGLFTTGIFGIVKNVATFIWLFFLVDRVGRRPLLLFGALIAGLCMIYVGGYIAIGKPAQNTNGITSGGISAVAFIYIWTAAYGPTWNGTPWVIASEVFPQHVRTLTQSLLSASQWVWQFVIARATPYMFLSMGYGTYLFFGLLTLLGGVYVFFVVVRPFPFIYIPKHRADVARSPRPRVSRLSRWMASSGSGRRVRGRTRATLSTRAWRGRTRQSMSRDERRGYPRYERERLLIL
jgi:sugar porter (SP) family MFS transporter